MQHRFFLYFHDGMGLGHTRRNLATASALTELSSKSSAIFASSGEIGRFSLPKNVDVLTLPGSAQIGQRTLRAAPLTDVP